MRREHHIFGEDDDHLVLALNDVPQLQARRDYHTRDKGLTIDFPVYRPHVTITKTGGADFLKQIPYIGEIVLGPEVAELCKGVPDTLYIRRDVINSRSVLAWYRGLGMKDLVAPNKMHVTVIYSTTKPNHEHDLDPSVLIV